MFGIEELEKEFPFMNWTLFLRTILGDNDVTEEDLMVMISSPQYLKEASGLVEKVLEREEGSEMLDNFLKWRVVDGLVPLLSKPFRQERSDLNNRLSGMKPR